MWHPNTQIGLQILTCSIYSRLCKKIQLKTKQTTNLFHKNFDEIFCFYFKLNHLFLGKELKDFLDNYGKEKTKVNKFFCVNHSITLVPLQMIQQKVESIDDLGHFHTRNEISQTVSKNPVSDISIKELFSKAMDHAKTLTVHDQYPIATTRKNDIIKLGNIVGVIGQAGMGKTTLSKIILAQVLNEGLFNVKYVFYLQFRNIDYKAKTNLLSFLTPTFTFPWIQEEKRRNAVLKKLSQTEEVLLIFDGFDEAVLDNFNSPCQISMFEKSLPEIFIKNILQGSLFSFAKKLITSRPRQLLKLDKNLKPDFIVNITGLDIQAQYQICKDICGSNAELIFNYIQHHPQIGSYCYVPANAILVMHAMNSIKTMQLKSGSTFKFPNTMTGVLAVVIGLLAKSPLARSKIPLEKLAALAWKGFLSKNFCFTEDDLAEVGLIANEENLFLLTVLANNTNNSIISIFSGDPKKISYFAHLLIQEFFVAVKLLFYTSASELQKLLIGTSIGPIPIYKSIYNLIDSNWEVVAKFLYGLSNVKTCELLEEQFSFLPSDLQTKSKMLCEYLLQSFPDSVLLVDEYFQQILRVCTWAYELSSEKLAAKIAKRLENKLIIAGKFLPNDISPVLYVLQHRQTPLYLDTTQFNTWFVGDSLTLFLEELQNLQINSIVSVSAIYCICVL